MHYVIQPDFAADRVMGQRYLDLLTLTRLLGDRPLQPYWAPPPVSIQRRARRCDTLGFLRNAPVLTRHAADRVRGLQIPNMELLELPAGDERLFVLNTFAVCDKPFSGELPPIFRVRGMERDCLCASERFRREVDAAGISGMQFVDPSSRFSFARPVPWPFSLTGWAFRAGEPPATSERIAQAEDHVGLGFPKALRQLFATANGGTSADDRGFIRLAVLSTGNVTAERTYELVVAQLGLVPWTWFPFASDGCGNDLFVDCGGTGESTFLSEHEFPGHAVPFREGLSAIVSSIVIAPSRVE